MEEQMLSYFYYKMLPSSCTDIECLCPLLLVDELLYPPLLGCEDVSLELVQQADAVEEVSVVSHGRRVAQTVADCHA